MEWTEGHIRLFMSHLSEHKKFVDRVARNLADRGVDAFVAHRTIRISERWEAEIQQALQTCDALVAFLHEGFHESPWTDQEVGFAIARNLPILPLDLGTKPYGFMRSYQAAPCADSDEPRVAGVIYEALLTNPEIGPKTIDALIESLAQSRTFDQANSRVKLLVRVPRWNSTQLDALKDTLANDQVAGAFEVSKVLKTIFATYPRSRRWVTELWPNR